MGFVLAGVEMKNPFSTRAREYQIHCPHDRHLDRGDSEKGNLISTRTQTPPRVTDWENEREGSPPLAPVDDAGGGPGDESTKQTKAVANRLADWSHWSNSLSLSLSH